MALKKYKPTTPGQRFKSAVSSEDITKKNPESSLIAPLKKSGGRNNNGRLTSRHRGGGHKKRYRVIDFKRDKTGVPGKVAGIEYDPNRSSRIALIHYADGEKRYILSPKSLEVGMTVMAGPESEIQIGNALPLKNIPLGTEIHNIEMYPGHGGQLARSAGSSVQLAAKEGDYAILKLPSGEMRMVRLNCMATIGQVGNIEHENVSIGKAGRSRWMGKRPHTRGVAMNPIDHPMGGGEGKSSGGRHPCSPWGKITKGLKTRPKKKKSNKFIIKRRAS